MSRVTVSGVLAAVATSAAAVTVAVPEWIEDAFGVDPDRGSGAVEWMIVGLLLAFSLLLAAHTVRLCRSPP